MNFSFNLDLAYAGIGSIPGNQDSLAKLLSKNGAPAATPPSMEIDDDPLPPLIDDDEDAEVNQERMLEKLPFALGGSGESPEAIQPLTKYVGKVAKLGRMLVENADTTLQKTLSRDNLSNAVKQVFAKPVNKVADFGQSAPIGSEAKLREVEARLGKTLEKLQQIDHILIHHGLPPTLPEGLRGCAGKIGKVSLQNLSYWSRRIKASATAIAKTVATVAIKVSAGNAASSVVASLAGGGFTGTVAGLVPLTAAGYSSYVSVANLPSAIERSTIDALSAPLLKEVNQDLAEIDGMLLNEKAHDQALLRLANIQLAHSDRAGDLLTSRDAIKLALAQRGVNKDHRPAIENNDIDDLPIRDITDLVSKDELPQALTVDSAEPLSSSQATLASASITEKASLPQVSAHAIANDLLGWRTYFSDLLYRTQRGLESLGKSWRETISLPRPPWERTARMQECPGVSYAVLEASLLNEDALYMQDKISETLFASLPRRLWGNASAASFQQMVGAGESLVDALRMSGSPHVQPSRTTAFNVQVSEPDGAVHDVPSSMPNARAIAWYFMAERLNAGKPIDVDSIDVTDPDGQLYRYLISAPTGSLSHQASRDDNVLIQPDRVVICIDDPSCQLPGGATTMTIQQIRSVDGKASLRLAFSSPRYFGKKMQKSAPWENRDPRVKQIDDLRSQLRRDNRTLDARSRAIKLLHEGATVGSLTQMLALVEQSLLDEMSEIRHIGEEMALASH